MTPLSFILLLIIIIWILYSYDGPIVILVAKQ